MWSYATDNQVESSPALADGVVYVGSDDGNTYALNASTGAKLWSYTTGSNKESSPAVANGVVYTGSLYAFSLGTGTADLFLRIWPSTTTVHQGDLITYAFPVWNLGPVAADQEVLNTQVPEGTTLDYIRTARPTGARGTVEGIGLPGRGLGMVRTNSERSLRKVHAQETTSQGAPAQPRATLRALQPASHVSYSPGRIRLRRMDACENRRS
jgi:uncharacterized repeat protein (TIGR01451 family)